MWSNLSQLDSAAETHRGRRTVAPHGETLAGTPLADVGVGSAAVAVSILITSLVISICKEHRYIFNHELDSRKKLQNYALWEK